MSQLPNSSRIELVDALRGFAVMAIMLLHNLEHFDLYFFPEYLPLWQKSFDKNLWDTLFFLFAGKAYAIFALLFGFSFYIQFNNQKVKGNDFRLRFLWRLFILLIFGFINSLFYQGDILSFYAFLGFALVIVANWSDKAVLWTAIFLMVQPFEWARFIYTMLNPEYVVQEHPSYHYFDEATKYLTGNSFFELVKGNITNGRLGVVLWTWESGRVFQAPALFMLGMLIGRRGLFITTAQSNFFWKKSLLVSMVSFAIFFTLVKYLPDLVERKSLWYTLDMIFTTWSNVSFMVVLVASFVLLYRMMAVQKVLSYLVPFGKMSLSNYLIQSIVGSFIYYGYGLALYKYTGASYSFLIGFVLFLLQLAFCHYWLKRHSQGPLESLWHKATWWK